MRWRWAMRPTIARCFAAAGCGVVVRSARPEVVAAADARCTDPDQAGVADVLQHFGLTG